jgi:Protein of unknown function (DUF1302)
MSTNTQRHRAFLPAVKVSAAAVASAVVSAIALSFAGSANAIQFTYDSGVSGSFDTTLSYGLSIRAQAPIKSLIGITNGGSARSVNEDDGNRNYKKGSPFANVIKATSDLDLKYEGWGFFARGTYFVDFANRNKDFLGPIGKTRSGEDGRMLDTFVTKSFDLGGPKLRIRAGNQVISWGESTFIPNSINSINSVDLVKLRTPGSELKEAFLPTSSLLASIEITKAASVEAFVQFNHDRTKLDPRGSYWSNNDFASDDANQVFLSFGRRNDLTRKPVTNPVPPTAGAFYTASVPLLGSFDPAAAVWAPRAADRDPSDHGQYGVAFRYLASELNNTEFGFYFLNYHSRIPFLSGTKGTVTSALTSSPLLAVACGTPALTAAGLCQTGTANYYTEYPENIRLLGFSFNTQGPIGTALQGEVSYRPNQPLAIAAPEVLLAALGAPNLLTGFRTIPGTVDAAAGRPFGVSAAGLVPNGTRLQGWERVKMMQAQMTATKGIPNILGADQFVFVGELGFTKYIGLNNNLKFNGPGVSLPATQEGAVAGQAGSVQTEGFITENSWGYRLVTRAEYPNLFFNANVAPRVAFNHDVKGVSQTFTEGVKSVSLGTNFDWQKKLSLDLSYTNFFGGRTFCGTDQITNPGQTALAAQINGVAALGRAPQGASYCTNSNPIRDRDFYSVVVTYSF